MSQEKNKAHTKGRKANKYAKKKREEALMDAIDQKRNPK